MRKRSVIAATLAALAVAGCGSQATRHDPSGAKASASRGGSALPVAHPQAVEPIAGAAAPASSADASAPQVASVSVDPPGASSSLPQPESLTEVRDQLTQSGMTGSTTQATLTPGGLAVAPVDAPPAVQDIIDAGNQIARLPYRWGGGHETYQDTAYDCSGSLSYVLAAAGLLNQTETSGELMSYGDPGPGKWITIFATEGHTFMYVAGLRFDTVALAETGSRWSDRPADEPDLSSFVERHPPGL